MLETYWNTFLFAWRGKTFIYLLKMMISILLAKVKYALLNNLE